ncbi:hypothetical protein LXA43DRAFT_641474 [Ganoderma leucocontextum]|nr:hypothetical protein LXA43DRAFT_641474 [Ganoderma leucocontextum]
MDQGLCVFSSLDALLLSSLVIGDVLLTENAFPPCTYRHLINDCCPRAGLTRSLGCLPTFALVAVPCSGPTMMSQHQLALSEPVSRESVGKGAVLFSLMV